MNSDFNALAGILIGAFLIKVSTAGKSKEMMTLAVRDKAFLKWFIAIVILMYIRSFPQLHKIGSELIGAAFLGFLLLNITTIKTELSKVWSNLK